MRNIRIEARGDVPAVTGRIDIRELIAECASIAYGSDEGVKIEHSGLGYMGETCYMHKYHMTITWEARLPIGKALIKIWENLFILTQFPQTTITITSTEGGTPNEIPVDETSEGSQWSPWKSEYLGIPACPCDLPRCRSCVLRKRNRCNGCTKFKSGGSDCGARGEDGDNS